MKTTRRNAIRAFGCSTASFGLTSLAAGHCVGDPEIVTIGMVADTHIGLSPKAEKRLATFCKAMQSSSPKAIMQLGDFAFPNAKHQSAPDLFNDTHQNSLHVIGNHDLDYGLTTNDCLKAWGIPAPYYRHDLGGIRILVLDGNDRGSPSHRGGYPKYIGPKQKKWLARELELSDRPILIASHQPLAGPSAVDNCEDLQKILGRHKEKILLCVNGHTHMDLVTERQSVRFLHLNSASYFWMGGKVRMAHYREPLFTTITIDPENRVITVEGKKSNWVGKSPKEHGYFTGNKNRIEYQDTITPQIRSRKFKS